MSLKVEGMISLLVGITAGIAAYLVYPQTGLGSSLLVGFGVAWLLFGITNPSRFLTMLGFLMNPPMTALITFFLAFIYFSFRGFQFWQSFSAGFVAALFGGIAGFVIFNYWNIGA